MIWVDITNMPHVLFFREFIKENDALVTTRDFGSLHTLLEMNGIEYISLGRHGGADKKAKLLESTKRVHELTDLISEHTIGVAVAKHSVELPRVAYGLGIPSIFVVDNEYAVHQNRLTLPLATDMVMPQALDTRLIMKHGADMAHAHKFKGVCEASHLKGFKPDKGKVKEYGEYVVVRPEPYTASYFQSESHTQELINRLKGNDLNVIVLPRGTERYDNATHLESLDTLNLLYHAKAFFGGGGTMNREAAILGTPAVSFYSQELLGVDRMLINLGLLHHTTSLDLDLSEILSAEGLRSSAKRILKTFQDPFSAIEGLMRD